MFKEPKPNFMSYSQICPQCGFKSEKDQNICPGCGGRKELNTDESDLQDIIYDEIDSKVRFISSPSIYVKILISLVILFSGIFLLPDFLRKSETFWMIYAVSNVFTIIKSLDKNFIKLHGIYFVSKIFLSVYLGGAIGNIISFSGRNPGFYFSFYFNPRFLFLEIIMGNALIIAGAVIGALTFLIAEFLKDSLIKS